MKKIVNALFFSLAAALVLIIASCASAATLMSRGDNVGAIEKLANDLTKKPNDQQNADMFNSLYPSEVYNRMEYTERNVPDIINDWVSSKGQTSLTAALRAHKQTVGTSRFLADDGEIRSLINEMEITQKNLNDLERIQRAVLKMPSEIGEFDVTYVEKFSDNFSGMSQIAKRSMAEFYYELANASAPGATRSQKIQLYELYGKVNEYSTGYSGISAKRAESAYAVAEDYLSGSTIEEKKEALNWFNKANIAVTNYNDTNTRIRETNYEIGKLYIVKWDANNLTVNDLLANEYKIRSDFENAIKYLEASKGYKDASTHIANCRKVLAALDELHAAAARSGTEAGTTTNTGTTNTGTTNTGTTNSGSTNTNTGTTPAATAKKSVLVPDAPKFSLGSNNKINAAVSVVTQGDISLNQNSIKLVSNTAGATVKSITVLKSIDSSFTKYKTRDLSAKTGSYTINFELSKAGQFTFNIVDASGLKVELATADGRAGTISPTYTLSDGEYSKFIPTKIPNDTKEPSKPALSKLVQVSDTASFKYENNTLIAYVSVKTRDVSLSSGNIKFVTNTAGAKVKSIAASLVANRDNSKDLSVSFELTKAGSFSFNVVESGTNLTITTASGKTATVSPTYTLTDAKYKELVPTQTTPTPTPSTPTAKAPVVLVDSNAKYSVVNKKVNATVNIAVEGDLNVTASNIKFDLNTVGATVKSVTSLKTLDTSLTKIQTPVKTKGDTTKVTGYTITFELSKAGQFVFRVLDAKGGKVQHNATNGNKDTCSPLYTLTQAEYDKLIPPAQTTPTPTPSTPIVTAPVILVDSNAKYSVVNNKINATVNIAVEGDLSVTTSNIRFDANTAGATVKSVTPAKTLDTSLTKIQTLEKTKSAATKTNAYTITFELSKAGQFVFRVLDAKGGKVQHNATNGNKDTCSPLYTLTQAEYDKLIPPVTTTPTPTPTPIAVKPTMVADSTAKFSKGTNSKVNAAVNVVVIGDLNLAAGNVKLSTNTAGATVKSVTAQSAIDSTLSKSKSLTTLKSKTKTTGYVITFELSKAGQFAFNVVDSITVKSPAQVEIATIEGKASTVSPIYTLTQTEYEKLYPPQVTPVPTPITAKPTMVADSVAKFSKGTNSKVNAAVNVIVIGDLNLAAGNVKLSTNTAGATVKSVTAQSAIDSTLSKSKSLTTLKSKTKTTGYVITFELSKAGQFAFNVVDSITVKSPAQVEIATIEGKASTVSPIYTLTQTEYEKLYPPQVTPTPTPVVTKPSVLVPATANFKLGAGDKVNATITILTQGDVTLATNSFRMVTNTANATVKSVEPLKSIDTSFSTFKTRDLKATKTASYKVTFELVKAGQFTFNIIDGKGGKIDLATADGRTDVISPIYKISDADYDKYIPKVATITYKDGQYSTNSAEYYIPFALVNYSSPVSMNEINVTKNTTGGTVTVTGTAADAKITIRNMTKTGVFSFTYKDRNTGKVMANTNGKATPEYSIDFNKVWVQPTLQYFMKSSSAYQTYEPTVKVPFEVTGLTYYLTKNNINVGANVCGAVWTLEHDNVSTLGRNTTVKYYVVLSDIKKSGDFTYSVLDNAGKVMTSTKNKTTDTMTVDFSKVFAQSVMYNENIFYSKAGEANTNFNTYGIPADRQVKHIKIVTNTTGATVKSVTRSDNGRLSYMRVYDIVFTGIKNDGVISFYVLDDAGKNLAVVQSVNGDEISAPTRNPTANDIVKLNVKVANIKSVHQLVYGSAPKYPDTKGQVTIPFTLKPSGTAPSFTASSVTVLTNGTGGSVSSVQSLGNNNYNIVLDNVTKSGTFQYRLKDANGYTITPEGFKNSGGATHSSAASPAYSIDYKSVSDGTSNLRVVYDSTVSYPSTLGTAKITFTVSDPSATAKAAKTVKELGSVTPPAAGTPIQGIPAATVLPTTPTSLKMSNVDVRTNTTGGTPSLNHLGSGKYELVLSNVTKSGTFQIQLKDNNGRLIVHPNFTGAANTILSPAYSINIASVASGKVKTADTVVYASENNAVVEKLAITAEGGLTLAASNFTLVTNTCGAKILRLDRSGSSNNYTLVLSATKAGKFSFSVTVGSITPTVYRAADTMYKKAASTPKNVSAEFEVSVASGGTLDEKLKFLKELDGFKPAQTLDVTTLKQNGIKGSITDGVKTQGTVQGTLNGTKTGTVQLNNSMQEEMNKVQDKIEADGALKGKALNDKVKR